MDHGPRTCLYVLVLIRVPFTRTPRRTGLRVPCRVRGPWETVEGRVTRTVWTNPTRRMVSCLGSNPMRLRPAQLRLGVLMR